ncbi:hypothetical protein GCM10023321_26140 [Pseudonocardia eucalypti]|uniref:Phospholipase D-like protein n=2 Tax=Pseudonocardia eucalypti TaxID=648755 RepID=A0ABP9PYZ2_9PSEU
MEDEDKDWLTPYDLPPDYRVGPVRMVGWSGSQERKPLLHAKLLVLGQITEEGPGAEPMRFFRPQSVWWGSANWTEQAKSHLEMGVWCDDEELAWQATRFLDDLICFSEPLRRSPLRAPSPELVAIAYPDLSNEEYEAWADDLTAQHSEDIEDEP